MKNPMQHARTKHIDVQHHFVRKRVENGEVTFEYYSTEDMVANVLMKALPKE
jgi:methyl coenzyme M reductase subunit D